MDGVLEHDNFSPEINVVMNIFLGELKYLLSMVIVSFPVAQRHEFFPNRVNGTCSFGGFFKTFQRMKKDLKRYGLDGDPLGENGVLRTPRSITQKFWNLTILQYLQQQSRSSPGNSSRNPGRVILELLFEVKYHLKVNRQNHLGDEHVRVALLAVLVVYHYRDAPL
ncbi:hypothetical protein OUZ56_018614 [Daphnia magna]|uniref:Uncharacterized protein n=1 Tax=Daphnia magna TaxID=35525 RepID=A0ABQ9Z9B4_9CRUS|nr:hypothetical protein OUZ56_018614 [Daphnia magna]